MSENLPINVDADQEVGAITYANEVIAIIAGMAANEVDGVASLINTNAIADLFGRAKPVTRGVKVEVGVDEASVDLVLTVEYGKPIQKVCTEVQESVRKAIETMTGLHVVKVDVHVVGISFERETQELEQGYAKATTAHQEDNARLNKASVAPIAGPAKQPESPEETPEDEEIDVDIPDDDAEDASWEDSGEEESVAEAPEADGYVVASPCGEPSCAPISGWPRHNESEDEYCTINNEDEAPEEDLEVDNALEE